LRATLCAVTTGAHVMTYVKYVSNLKFTNTLGRPWRTHSNNGSCRETREEEKTARQRAQRKE
jgi:hypothetical protein